MELFLGILSLDKANGEKEEFRFPVRNLAGDLARGGLFCPGSFVKVLPLENQPLTLGLPREVGVFFRARAVFPTSLPVDMDRRVIGKFPEKGSFPADSAATRT